MFKVVWSWVLVNVFRRPPVITKSKTEIDTIDPYEDMDSEAIRNELLYGNFHEECGDR